MYVNEVGHDVSKKQSVHVSAAEDKRTVEYKFVLPVSIGHLRKGHSPLELLTDYGKGK